MIRWLLCVFGVHSWRCGPDPDPRAFTEDCRYCPAERSFNNMEY